MSKNIAIAALAVSTVCAWGNGAMAQPSANIQISSSTDDCGGASRDNPGTRRKIYAKNTSATLRISANLKYDTDPSGQKFRIQDGTRTSYTEQYPKFYEHRLAPGERKQVGCSSISRPDGTVDGYVGVPIVTTLEGAVYVDPNDPAPPAEDPKLFGSFTVEPRGNNRSCLVRPYGFVRITNTHPSRRISFRVRMIDHRGRYAGTLLPSLGPSESTLAGCDRADQVNLTPGGIESAIFAN